jgi:large subunit ribosomal protein L17
MNKVIKKYRIQGTTSSHKHAMIKSLIIELIRAERIKTTPTKAKIVKSKFDRLVTHAKKDTQGSKGVLKSFFNSDERAISRLYSIAGKLNDRNSGYTRLIKTLPRRGDNAQQVYVSIINTEVKEKTSKLQKTLARQEKPAKKAKASKTKTEE